MTCGCLAALRLLAVFAQRDNVDVVGQFEPPSLGAAKMLHWQIISMVQSTLKIRSTTATRTPF